MTRVMLSIAIALAIAACGTPAAQPGTGIQGSVQVGPTCPVERINSPCPPHPMAATVVVRSGNGAEVTRFHSGPDGRFKVDLAPGSYTLIGLQLLAAADSHVGQGDARNLHGGQRRVRQWHPLRAAA